VASGVINSTQLPPLDQSKGYSQDMDPDMEG
jgi:hypothetical protein